MKAFTLIIAALLAAPLWAVVPMPVPEVVPVKRLSVEGFIKVDSGWQWNGDQFRVNVLETPEENYYGESLARLVFDNDRTYREAVQLGTLNVETRTIAIELDAADLGGVVPSPGSKLTRTSPSTSWRIISTPAFDHVIGVYRCLCSELK